MRTARKKFTDTNITDIENALINAGEKTSLSIIPIIARRSDRYEGLNYLFGFIFSIAAFVICWFYFNDATTEIGSWSVNHTLTTNIFEILIIMLVAFMIGTYVAAFIPTLKLFFLSRRELRHQVSRAAKEALYQTDAKNNFQGSAMIIYISLLEHIVKIQITDQMAEKINAKELKKITNTIIRGIKKSNLTDGIIAGITKVVELSAEKLPVEANKANTTNKKMYFWEGYRS